jgi:predicted alpha/beta hydrolase
METIPMQTLTIPVPSRYGPSETEGHLTLPETAPRAFLTIHPATATPERFYFSFAEAAAARGFAVLTYGLRGVGSPAARQHRNVRMRDWMSEDVPAAASWAVDEFPDLPHVALGHSVGGHALLLGYGGSDLRGIVTVATHLAATRDIVPVGERLRVRAALSVLGPLASRTLGYMPGKRLGLGEDIPRAALLDWSRWVGMDEYFFDDPTVGASARMARLRTPVLSVGAADDLWASPEQVDALVDRLRLAPLQRRTFTPTELGVENVGHHGLMRRSRGQAAWPEILDWLEAKALRPATPY